LIEDFFLGFLNLTFGGLMVYLYILKILYLEIMLKLFYSEKWSTGIGEEEYIIQIFPNPTTDILNIKMENPTLANFSIFDIYGKRFWKKRRWIKV